MQQLYILKKDYFDLYQPELQKQVQPIDFWQRLNIPIERIIEDVNIDISCGAKTVVISIKVNTDCHFIFPDEFLSVEDVYNLIQSKQ